MTEQEKKKKQGLALAAKAAAETVKAAKPAGPVAKAEQPSVTKPTASQTLQTLTQTSTAARTTAPKVSAPKQSVSAAPRITTVQQVKAEAAKTVQPKIAANVQQAAAKVKADTAAKVKTGTAAPGSVSKPTAAQLFTPIQPTKQQPKAMLPVKFGSVSSAPRVTAAGQVGAAPTAAQPVTPRLTSALQTARTNVMNAKPNVGIGALKQQEYAQTREQELAKLQQNAVAWHKADEAGKAALKAENDAIRARYGLNFNSRTGQTFGVENGQLRDLSEQVREWKRLRDTPTGQAQLGQTITDTVQGLGRKLAYDNTGKLGVFGHNTGAGFAQIGKGFYDTVDFLLPDVITPKVLQEQIDKAQENYGGIVDKVGAMNQAKGGAAGQFAGGLYQSAIGMLPQAVVSMMTAGLSTAATAGGSLAATAAANSSASPVLTRISQQLINNAPLMASFSSTVGSDYEEAKANGANDAQAAAYAIIVSALNAGIEVGGGVETMVNEPANWRNMLKSAFEEGGEEVMQGGVSGFGEKLIYNHDKAWTGEGGVADPYRMAQEFGAGALLAGAMGGGRMAVDSVLGANAQTQPDAAKTQQTVQPDAAKMQQTETRPTLEQLGQRQAELEVQAQQAAYTLPGAMQQAEMNRINRELNEVQTQIRQEVQRQQEEAVQSVNENAAQTAAEVQPIRVGRATTIQKPYTGKVPVTVQTEQTNQPIVIGNDAVQAAQQEIEKAKKEDKFTKPIKILLKSVFNAAGGPRPVTVQSITFDGKPYEVALNMNLTAKVASDKIMTAEKLAAFYNLDKAVETANYVGSGAYNKQNEKTANVIRYDYFEKPLSINGADFIMTFDVEVYNGTNNFRTYRVLDVNKIDLVPVAATRQSLSGGYTTNQPSLSADTIAQADSSVKPQAETLPQSDLDTLRQLREEAQSDINAIRDSAVELTEQIANAQRLPDGAGKALLLDELNGKRAALNEQLQAASDQKNAVTEQLKQQFAGNEQASIDTVEGVEMRMELLGEEIDALRRQSGPKVDEQLKAKEKQLQTLGKRLEALQMRESDLSVSDMEKQTARRAAEEAASREDNPAAAARQTSPEAVEQRQRAAEAAPELAHDAEEVRQAAMSLAEYAREKLASAVKPKNAETAAMLAEASAQVKAAEKAAADYLERSRLTEKDKRLAENALRSGTGSVQWDVADDMGAAMRYAEMLGEIRAAKQPINEFVREDKAIKQSIASQAAEFFEAYAKDKRFGLQYSTETMERNIYDVFGKEHQAEAQFVIDNYIKPIHEAAAERTRLENYFRNPIADLHLTGHESAITQMWLEGHRAAAEEYCSLNGIKVTPAMEAKINNAVEVFRKSYDEIFYLANDVSLRNGLGPLPHRMRFAPHFTLDKPNSIAAKLRFALIGKDSSVMLPTEIAGMTEEFRPGKKWSGHFLQREGEVTVYDAVKGFEHYIPDVLDLICYTDSIQNLRTLEDTVRWQFSNEALREQVENIWNDEELDTLQQRQKVEELYSDNKTTREQLIADLKHQHKMGMGGFVAELRRYTDNLAGKKAKGDRGLEERFNREAYTAAVKVNSRFSANAVAGNVASALTNFIPITQAAGEVSPKYILSAMQKTIANHAKNDGFVDASDYLTRRINTSDRLDMSRVDKIGNVLASPMEWIDSFTSQVVTRAKYEQNIAQGMDMFTALDNADAYAASLMADRSKGATPTLFNETNPLTRVFTAFQLEVNNQLRHMVKDMPRDMQGDVKKLALGYTKMFVGAYVYNWAYEWLTGRKPAFSPIDIVKDAMEAAGFGGDDEDDERGVGERLLAAGKSIVTDVLEETPFVGTWMGGGRVPIAGALPDVDYIWNTLWDDSDPAYKKQQIGNELVGTAAAFLMPYGGMQAKKTFEGAATMLAGGSRKVDRDGNSILQFPAYGENPAEVAKALIFGKTATEGYKDWKKAGFDTLSAKQTAVFDSMVGNSATTEQKKAALAAVKGISTIEGDTDENGKTIEGSKKKKQGAALLGNEALNGTQKAAAFRGLIGNEKEIAALDKLTSSYYKADEGATVEAIIRLNEIEPDYDENGKSINGSLVRKQREMLFADDKLSVAQKAAIDRLLIGEDGGTANYNTREDFIVSCRIPKSDHVMVRSALEGGASIDQAEAVWKVYKEASGADGAEKYDTLSKTAQAIVSGGYGTEAENALAESFILPKMSETRRNGFEAVKGKLSIADFALAAADENRMFNGYKEILNDSTKAGNYAAAEFAEYLAKSGYDMETQKALMDSLCKSGEKGEIALLMYAEGVTGYRLAEVMNVVGGFKGDTDANGVSIKYSKKNKVVGYVYGQDDLEAEAQRLLLKYGGYDNAKTGSSKSGGKKSGGSKGSGGVTNRAGVLTFGRFSGFTGF